MTHIFICVSSCADCLALNHFSQIHQFEPSKGSPRLSARGRHGRAHGVAAVERRRTGPGLCLVNRRLCLVSRNSFSKELWSLTSCHTQKSKVRGPHANLPVCVHSVASAMHSETPDRYERLTSVSSSVDFDQRDNVRTPSSLPPLPPPPQLGVS